ncbi:MAG: hypothetical protein JNL18_08905 [Planctomycetaceae bacterium]|uniref:PEP-CTERM protein-sorting domain-containing protein n=1 Tax=Lacipirellula limnantheis TaxID=2528024 RepID=A0A517U128_9BACT|nr:choice-of-anchor tandem repeat NxxGxxAF-containing protein [Lacipirellula limnantheis]MBL9162837.1 hypothetical protein [Planctomycetaceae bacterium]QDT74337.1 hypothetical protein I41_35320 [Lacipirellula limnantheis]
MRFRSHRSFATVAACAFYIAFAPAAASAQPYNFLKIADTSGPFSNFGEAALNNAGAVAFRADLDGGGEGVFLASGGVITTLAETSGLFSDFGDVSINSAGAVAFWAALDDGSEGIYAAAGGSLNTIATASSSGPVFRSFDTVAFGGRPSINDSGTVAFWAVIHNTGGSGIFTGNGGPTNTIIANGGDFYGFGNPSINDAGTVGFHASRFPALGGNAILASSGGPPTILADATGPLENVGVPVLNNDGTAIFLGSPDGGGMGLYTSSGGPVITVADNSGPFSSFFGHSINGAGRVAFEATLDSEIENGIYTGPDPVNDKVVKRFDTLFGEQVFGVIFGHGLNDQGDIAFWYTNANSLQTLTVARVVPEPTTLLLGVYAAAAIAAMGPRAIRQSARSATPLAANDQRQVVGTHYWSEKQ